MKYVHSFLGPFIGGLVFAIGLGVGGMTEPQNIIAFLDLFGDWDPSLMFVMVGAIGSYSILFRIITKAKSPLANTKFFLPTDTSIDKKLLIGSALFGVGWGITGLCPGPGLTTLSTGAPYGFVFIFTVVLGVFLAGWLERKVFQ